MKKFNNFSSMIEFVSSFKNNEWIYTNISEWNTSPETSVFWLISDDEVEDLDDEDVYEWDYGAFLPKSLEDLNLRPWMLTDILIAIMRKINVLDLPTDDTLLIIDAINFYRENDNFMTSETKKTDNHR